MSRQLVKGLNGFSLVTAMIAVVIVSIIAAAFGKLINDSVVAQSQIDTRMSVQTMRLSLIERLSDRATCQASLAGRDPLTNTGPAITQVVNSVGTVLFQTSAGGPGAITYENNRVRISRFFFVTNPNHTFRQFVVGGREGSLELSVDIAPISRVAGGLDSFVFPIRLIANLDAADRILSCVAIGNDADDVWRMNAGAEIFYNGGNVGIGIDNPTFRLHVVGNVLSTGTISASARIDAPLISTTGAAGNVVAVEMRADRFLYTSDRNEKMNITPISDVEKLLQLQGVSFQWKSTGEVSNGLVAQEVEKIFPQVVHQDPQTGIKAIDYAQLLPLIVENLKAMDRRNRSLEVQLNHLEEQCSQRR